MNQGSNVGGFAIVIAMVGVVLALYAGGNFDADPGTPTGAAGPARLAQPAP